MAKHSYFAIIDGIVWVRGTNGGGFLSARVDARDGIGWSSKPAAGDGRTAVPIDPDGILERTLRAEIAKRAGGPISAPHSAWVRLDALDQRTRDLMDAAIHRHTHR